MMSNMSRIVPWHGGGRSTTTGRLQQGLTDPTLLGSAGEAVLEPVQPTANDVFGGRLAPGLHVTAVHPHRWRARKPGLVQLHPMGSGLAGEGIGDANPTGCRIGVDQVGRGQGSQRRLRFQLQVGRRPANYAEVRWASPGEERAQQGPMERLERAR
jgi:hypothetical protein